MKIYIKNMVCVGTKFYVLLELENLRINYKSFELGEIKIEEDLSLAEIKDLDRALHKYGLEIVFRKSKLVSRIREAIHDMIEDNITIPTSFPEYISKQIGHNYDYLNRYFIKETGGPIEEYYIEKKEEKIILKEPTLSDMYNSLGKSA